MKNQVKKNSVQKAGALFLTLSLLSAAPALAAGGPVMGGFENRMGMNQSMNAALADTASEIVNGTADNSASSIVKDMENASTIVMSDENSSVTITESGRHGCGSWQGRRAGRRRSVSGDHGSFLPRRSAN